MSRPREEGPSQLPWRPLLVRLELHDGPRTTRDGEVQAWVGSIRGGRQIHVQEVRRRDGSIAVFAHTEPEGYGLDHLVAAVLDRASFSGGAKVLLNDLRDRRLGRLAETNGNL